MGETSRDVAGRGARRRRHRDEPHILPLVQITPLFRRNGPCPCGSGVKFKKCHNKPGFGQQSDVFTFATLAGHPQEKPATFSYVPTCPPQCRRPVERKKETVK